MLTADTLASTAKLAQIPVIAGVVSGIFCVACFAKSLSSLGESENERMENIASLNIELANGRIGHNHALNETKTWALNGAFWSMAVALFVELGAIAYVAFANHPS